MTRARTILFTLWLSMVSVAGQAQERSKFWDNWFVQANLAGNVFYGSQEVDYDFSDSPMKGFRQSLNLTAAIGKWFSPEIALRTKVNGIWGRTIISEDAETNASKFFTISEQALLDLTNIIWGVSQQRRYHLILVMGGGVGRNMSYDSWATNLSLGLLNQVRLTKRLLLNAELGYVLHTAEFDGARYDGTSTHSLFNEDRQLLLEVGVTYHL